MRGLAWSMTATLLTMGVPVMPYMNGYWLGFGSLLMVLFWVFVIAGIVWLVLTFAPSQARGDGGESGAMRILAERLARGEIDAEEFRARRAAILETKQ